MNDIVVGIQLKADGSGLVGEVRLSKKEVDTFSRSIENSGQKSNRAAKGVDRFARETKNASHQSRGFVASLKNMRQNLFSIQGAIGATGLALISKNFIAAASTSEQYRIRLQRLLGSVGEGNRLFSAMSRYAGQVSFEYEQIMGAATQLSGVMKGGVNQIKQWMPLIGDLAAVSGLSIEQSTEQVVRMYSAGAGAADLFRERGISSMLGFQAGVSYSAEETRKKLMQEWLKAGSQFRGAAKDLGTTWSGMTSMFSDKWFDFRNRVMNSGLFEGLKSKAATMLDTLNQMASDGSLQRWAENTANAVMLTVGALTLMAKVVAVGGVLILGNAALISTLAILSPAFAALTAEAGLAFLVMRSGVGPVALITSGLAASAAATWASVKAFGMLKAASVGLFTLWAGWEIGSFLQKEFATVRMSATALIAGLHKGWIHFNTGVQVIWEEMKGAWHSTINAMKAPFAAFLESVSSGLSYVPGTSGLDKSLQGVISNLRSGGDAADQTRSKIAALLTANDKAIASVDKVVTSMFADDMGLSNRKTSQPAQKKDQGESSPSPLSNNTTGAKDSTAAEKRRIANVISMQQVKYERLNQMAAEAGVNDEQRTLLRLDFDLMQMADERDRLIEQKAWTDELEIGYEEARISRAQVSAEQLAQIEEQRHLDSLARMEEYQQQTSTLQDMFGGIFNQNQLTNLNAMGKNLGSFINSSKVLWKQGWQGQAQVMSGAFGMMQGLMQSGSRKLFEIGKVAGISKASVDTFIAINSAMASIPFPFNLGAAALVGAAGLANVMKISSTSYGQKSSGASSVPSYSGGASNVVPINPSTGVAAQTASPAYVTESSQNQNQQPQPVTNIYYLGTQIGTTEYVRQKIMPAIYEADLNGEQLALSPDGRLSQEIQDRFNA